MSSGEPNITPPILTSGGPESRSERFAFFSILLFGFFCPISIGAAQAFAALAFLAWIISLPRRGLGAMPVPPFLVPLAIFVVLSLMAVFFSINPGQSIWDARRLLVFLLIPLFLSRIDSLAKGRMVIAAVAAGALVTSGWGFIQVITGAGGGESRRRLTGFLGHYMTAGGELMLITVLLVAVFFFTRRRWERLAGLGVAAVLCAAMGLTQSRNAYVGLAVALTLILFLWRPGIVALLPFALSLAVLLSPPIVRERIFSIANVQDASIRNRFAMIETGMAITADFPLFGAGLQQVEVINLRYRGPEPTYNYSHLHNNILQIAAERGIPAALAWIWMLALLGAGHFRLARRANAPPWLKAAAAGACAAVVALFIAGMFEYNFGDLEVLMLFLLLTSIPYALAGALHAGKNDAR